MPGSPFFRRLYLTFSLLVVVTAALIGLLIERQVRADRLGQIEQRLAATAGALHPLAVRGFTESNFDVDTLIDEVGARSGARVTLIRPDGLVLADSERDPGRMDDHSRRPEVLLAMRDGRGVASRFSETVQIRMMYFADRLDRNDRTLGIVRVSIPLSEIDEEILLLRWQIARGATLAIVLALGLGVVVARRITGPIAQMTEVSEALRVGDYDVRVTTTGSDEIHTLGRNLNLLAGELGERVSSLSHQRAQLDAIIGSMQEGVLAIDTDRRVLVSNHVARELLDLPPADTRITTEVLASIPGLDRLIGELEAGAATARRELTRQRGDAEPQVLDARGARFEAADDAGMVIVFYDITAMRQLERIRTDFVANVSHELKTPLTSIKGYVETLLDGAVNDPDNSLRFLEKIRDHVNRLGALVGDLLSLARIEAPPPTAPQPPVDWVEIVEASVAQRRDRAADRGLTLTLTTGHDEVPVLGESEGMRQIVDNLLDNAIAYTPYCGTIEVRVDRQGDRGVLTIRDSGIGIPDDAIPRIFERFYRVDRGRSRQLGGTGLGLSIVRNLVARMAGTVSVQSEVGKGSTFVVTLPLAPDAA